MFALASLVVVFEMAMLGRCKQIVTFILLSSEESSKCQSRILELPINTSRLSLAQRLWFYEQVADHVSLLDEDIDKALSMNPQKHCNLVHGR